MNRALALTLIVLAIANFGASCFSPNFVIGGWVSDHRHTRQSYLRLVDEGRIVEAFADGDDVEATRARIIGTLAPPQRSFFPFMISHFVQGVVLFLAGWALMPGRASEK